MTQSLASLIEQAQTVLQGRSPGGGNTGQQISVRVQGRSPLQAVCGGIVPPGECTIFNTQQGWIVLSPISPVAIAVREVQSRQSRRRDRAIQGSNIKTLLTRVNVNGLTEVYIGGDRELPTLIYTSITPGSIQNIGFTNLGIPQTSWAISISESGIFEDNFFQKYRFISPQEVVIWSEFTTNPEPNEIYMNGLRLANQIISRNRFIRTGDGGSIESTVSYQTVGLYEDQLFTLIDSAEQQPIIYDQPFPGVAILSSQYNSAISDWDGTRLSLFFTDDENYSLDAERLTLGQARFRLFDRNLGSTIFNFNGTQHPVDSAVTAGLGFPGYVGGVSFWGNRMYTIKSIGSAQNRSAIATVAPYLFDFSSNTVLPEQAIEAPYYSPDGFSLIQMLYHP